MSCHTQTSSSKGKRAAKPSTTTGLAESAGESEASTSGSSGLAGAGDVAVDWAVIERMFLGEGWDTELQALADQAKVKAAQAQQQRALPAGAGSGSSGSRAAGALAAAVGADAEEEAEVEPWRDEVCECASARASGCASCTSWGQADVAAAAMHSQSFGRRRSARKLERCRTAAVLWDLDGRMPLVHTRACRRFGQAHHRVCVHACVCVRGCLVRADCARALHRTATHIHTFVHSYIYIRPDSLTSTHT